jgi:hypothetical protein
LISGVQKANFQISEFLDSKMRVLELFFTRKISHPEHAELERFSGYSKEIFEF